MYFFLFGKNESKDHHFRILLRFVVNMSSFPLFLNSSIYMIPFPEYQNSSFLVIQSLVK